MKTLTERLIEKFQADYEMAVEMAGECRRTGDVGGVRLATERYNRLAVVLIQLKWRLV